MSKHKRDEETVRDEVETVLDDARDIAEDSLDSAYRYLQRQCRENPLGVTATALGVGLVIGMLLARRR